MPSGRKCGRRRRSWRGGDRITGMIRSIAIAATLGALVAGVAAYAIYPSMRPSEPTPAEQAAAAPDDWDGAIAVLKSAALRDPRNADIQNYIGYAYRRLRRMGSAIGHYQQALMLNPRHRSAHEHLGEAALVLGDAATAEQHLAHLEDICLIGCEEYDDLKRAIAGYNTKSH